MKVIIALLCLFVASKAAKVVILPSTSEHHQGDHSVIHKECEIHQKEIQKLEYKDEEKTECHKEPKEVCEIHEKLVCEEVDYKKVCVQKPVKECHSEEHEVCEKKTVKVPHHVTVKVPFKVCH